MSYTTVKAGLFERLETVVGLKVHLKYEPNTIQDAPAVYSILESFTRSMANQQATMHYRTLHRLWIKWQDNQAAETQMDSYVNAIPNAIDSNPKLSGRIESGGAFVVDGSAAWREIGGVLYRTIDFYSDTTEKDTLANGI